MYQARNDFKKIDLELVKIEVLQADPYDCLKRKHQLLNLVKLIILGSHKHNRVVPKWLNTRFVQLLTICDKIDSKAAVSGNFQNFS